MISDAITYEDNQGMERTSNDNPPNLRQSLEIRLTEEERLQWNEDYERARQNNARKSKQRRVRALLTSLNSLSAGSLAVISVVERQIAVLQDLHSVFLTNYRTKLKITRRDTHSGEIPSTRTLPQSRFFRKTLSRYGQIP